MSTVVAKQIFDSCTPLVKSGEQFAISVSQTLVDSQSEPLLALAGPNSVNIAVEGPQVQLGSTDIAGLYPVPDSKESPEDFLAHIALTRRTLPWERNGPQKDAPWLALLLLNDLELDLSPPTARQLSPKSFLQPLTIKDLEKQDNALYKALHLDSQPDDSTPVQVVTIPVSKLNDILPAIDEIAPFCHVKSTTRSVQQKISDGHYESVNVDEFHAIVISNRLPDSSIGTPAPILHHALLVSLENRGDLYPPDPKKVSTSLIVLKGWSFTPSVGGDFMEVMQAIRERPNGGVLRFGNLAEDATGRGRGTPQGALHSGLAAILNDNGYLQQPLAHTQEGNVVYRGPLLPFDPPIRSRGFAVRSAPDEFVNVPDGSPRDYSLSAAFEIGRLLAISDGALLEDVRGIHEVWKFPALPDIIKLPLAFQKPEWLVDPDQSPWASKVNGVSLVAQSPLLANVQANAYLGNPAQVAAWKDTALTGGLTEIGGDSTLSVDINQATGPGLVKQFPAVYNAARR